jgi:O-antigen/teichoic acid export membrane protein
LAANKLIRKFFSAGVQAFAVQFLGILFFYITSVCLSKNDFGVISWANAVSVTITTLLSFGLEQVVVRRIAASQSSYWAAAAYLLHSFVFSLLSLAVLGVLYLFFGSTSLRMAVLPGFFLVQALVFIGTPLKQFLNAQERFAPYAVIAFCSNLLKLIAGIIWARYFYFSIQAVLWILGIGALAELAALLVYITRNAAFSFRVRMSAYRKLLREALPQYVAVMFDTSLARIDWILIGILCDNIATANYSFAYRAFEVAKLPIVVVGTILLPRFSRLLQKEGAIDAAQKKIVNQVLQIEVFIAGFLMLALNIIWSPWVDALTHNKYGAGSALTFLLLSLCIPMQFAINLMWTLCFSLRKYKIVAQITMVTAIINLTANLVLIPVWKETGAAAAFLLATVVQTALYMRALKKYGAPVSVLPVVIFILAALLLWLCLRWLPISWAWQLLIAAFVFLTCFWVQKMRSIYDLKALKVFLRQ